MARNVLCRQDNVEGLLFEDFGHAFLKPGRATHRALEDERRELHRHAA